MIFYPSSRLIWFGLELLAAHSLVPGVAVVAPGPFARLPGPWAWRTSPRLMRTKWPLAIACSRPLCGSFGSVPQGVSHLSLKIPVTVSFGKQGWQILYLRRLQRSPIICWIIVSLERLGASALASGAPLFRGWRMWRNFAG